MFYNGGIVRELAGEAITERALVASAFNLPIATVEEDASIPEVRT